MLHCSGFSRIGESSVNGDLNYQMMRCGLQCCDPWNMVPLTVVASSFHEEKMLILPIFVDIKNIRKCLTGTAI